MLFTIGSYDYKEMKRTNKYALGVYMTHWIIMVVLYKK